MAREDAPGRGDIRPQWLDEATARSPVRTYDWAYRTWARPGGRIALAIVFLASSAYIITSLVSAPTGFFGNPLKAFVGIACVPPLIVGFSVSAVQALRDILQGTNKNPFFFRAGQWLSYTTAGKTVTTLWLIAVAGVVIAKS